MKKFLSYFIISAVVIICACSESNPVSQEDHFEASGLVLIKSDAIFMKIFKGSIDTTFVSKFEITKGESTEYFHVQFLNDSGSVLDPPEDNNKNFGWIVDDTTIVMPEKNTQDKWSFRLKGINSGTTSLELRLLHLDHPDFKTPKIQVVVK